MTLRLRLFALVAVLVTLTVVLVTSVVASSARQAFATLDAQRTAAIAAQIRREFAVQQDQIAQRLERIAASDTVQRTVTELGRSTADPARHVGDAGPLAAAQGLDFLDLVDDRGKILSSAQTPARFGYRHPAWADGGAAAPATPAALLQRIDLPSEHAVGFIATRTVTAGDHRLYVIGGRRLDDQFLAALVLPEGMRVRLYRDGDPATDAMRPLAARVRQTRQDAHERIGGGDGVESVAAIPLSGHDGEVLAVLLIASSDRELSDLMSRIRWTGVLAGALGIALGCGVSYLVASRVTRPIESLVDAVRDVADGRWNVDPPATDASGEVGALARSFARMTAQLSEQRDRLVQAERVAAWRELARRLAHELKNPLFPLRITIDNLRRAKALAPGEFDEVFDESLGTLTTGLASLNTVVARFSDFARMPVPEFAEVPPNDIVRHALKLFDAQLAAADRPPIRVASDLDASVEPIEADADQLGRALLNLLLNAIDAMPQGGELTIRTRRAKGGVRIDVADTGEGLTGEERARLFTPYYTTKQHGTGLGLAIVQSVVADHRGRIWVESEPGRGTTFHIELPQSHETHMS